MNYTIENISYSKDELKNFCIAHRIHAEPWLQSHLDFILEWLSPDEKIELTTSGSTGEPKKVFLPKADMRASAKLTAEYFRLPQATKALLALPSAFVAGKMMIVRALECHWNLKWTTPASNPLESLNHDVDFAAFTPMQVSTMLQDSPEKFNSIEKVIIGGGSVSIALQQQLMCCNNQVWATYGMTETTTHVAVMRLNGNEPDVCFHALPGIQFSQTDENKLIIHASHLSVGAVYTNDIVHLISPTSFRFLGRADNVINSGGVKIFPEKTEQIIARFITQPFFIGKRQDDILGERLVLFIESDRWSVQQERQLLSVLDSELKGAQKPKEIVAVKKFDRTGSGKIIRKNYE